MLNKFVIVGVGYSSYDDTGRTAVCSLVCGVLDVFGGLLIFVGINVLAVPTLGSFVGCELEVSGIP